MQECRWYCDCHSSVRQELHQSSNLQGNVREEISHKTDHERDSCLQIEITSQLILKSRPRVNVLRRKWNARNHQKVKEDGREKDINTEHLQVSHQKRLLCHKVVCDCTLPFCFTLYRISFIYSLACIRLFFKKGLFITTVVTRICFFITEKQVRKVWWKIHHNMCGCRQIYADKDSLRITELDRNIPPVSTKELCRYLN